MSERSLRRLPPPGPIAGRSTRDSGQPSAGVAGRASDEAGTADEARIRLTRLWSDEQAGKNDVPDLVAFMLATGARIGEATAVTWQGLDLGAGTVEIRSTVVRVEGSGPGAQEHQDGLGRAHPAAPALVRGDAAEQGFPRRSG